MDLLLNSLAIALISIGLAFMLAGSVGLLRLPDFYCRTHASSKVDTLGIIVVLIGFALYEGFTLNSAKLLLGAVFVALANPVAAHALAKAAFHSGIKPWFRNRKDATKRNGLES